MPTGGASSARGDVAVPRAGLLGLVRALLAVAVGIVVGVVLGAVAGVGPVAVAGTVAEPSQRPPSEALLLLVDYSGSMNRDDGTGSTRIESAERALREIVRALPEDLSVGLRAYGHRVPSEDKAAACQDTELVVPVAPLDRQRLLDTIEQLEPVGETPIGLSLQEAAKDLPDGVPATVILVSDGSDECWTDDLGPEPCEVTRSLVAQGLDLRLETIGLQVEPAGREQLECMAEAGGGEFTSVADAGLLADAIASARDRALRVFEPRGEPVSGGPSLIDATVLEPGTYTDSILDGETLWYAVDVPRGGAVTARLTIRTAEVPSDAAVALEWQDPQARRVDAAVLPSIARGQASTLALSTGEANGSRSPFGAEREPGPYYLAVRTSGFPADVEHEFVLELIGEGTAAAASAAPSDGPSGAATDGVSPAASASAAASPSGSSSAPSPAPTVAAELPPPPSTSPVPLLLLVLAAAGGVAGWFVWRRRSSRREDGPGYT